MTTRTPKPNAPNSPRARARCPACGRDYTLTRHGYIRAHYYHAKGGGYCGGSGAAITAPIAEATVQTRRTA